MRVAVGQIYVKPNVWFPFSHHMQRWLGGELTTVAQNAAPEGFLGKYGGDFTLMIRVSADTDLLNNKLKGPTVFKRTKDVEYTVFLPFDVIVASPDGRRVAADFLVNGIRDVFRAAGIDPTELDERREDLISRISSDPVMVSEPWPSAGGATR